MTWYGLKIKENCHLLVNQFHQNFLSKPLGCRRIKSVFKDVKWCFNASWGLKGLKKCITLIYMYPIYVGSKKNNNLLSVLFLQPSSSDFMQIIIILIRKRHLILPITLLSCQILYKISVIIVVNAILVHIFFSDKYHIILLKPFVWWCELWSIN